ncbi:VOC family protein [Patulibacter sp. SYSU D01012]|uniref:VOC family protein n=1 Tax=Patulibacter sp. SYSU D01012 TaxID=2817381 RepID=UPI001B30CC83|nr:VOC family protein [Patulibacter sp. SYSU D01012]
MTTLHRPAFHHVNLKTTRLQEMIDWYGLVVGAEVTYQYELGAWLTNDEANHRIALLSFPNFRDDPGRDEHAGMHHVAFEYDAFEALDDSYLRLREHGIVPELCLDHGVTFSYYYVDPDGNRVELQVDGFGDWATSKRWMATSEDFRRDPLGALMDPARVAADRAAGRTFAEIRETARRGGYAPEQA